MDTYQSYIAKSRYARYLPEQDRRENWDETVTRYLDFLQIQLKENNNYNLPLELREELYKAIHDLEVMPSMRALMTAGKALARDNTAGYNCFAGNEKFITKEGLKSFTETVDQQVTVLTNKGWKKAEIKSFGIQQLQNVTLRPTKSKSNIRRNVSVTCNHRWITKNRGIVTDIKVGDIISSSTVNDSTFIEEAFIRGFGFGDGTIDSRGRAKIRLCGEKATKWKSIFRDYGHASIWQPENMNGDIMVSYHKGHQENWKILPLEKIKDLDYLSSWLSGYMAADGSGDVLSSQNIDAIEFVEQIAPLCGFVVTGKNTSTIMETNYGIRKNPLTKITLRKECDWYVTNIEMLDEDEVFCAIEPETKSFTLGFGCLTGNCAYLVVDDPKAFDEAMFILMCGTGVGFSVERQYVNKLPEVPDVLFHTDTTIQVKDSKEGWAKSLRMLIAMLYAGEIPKWDTSKVRGAGAPLKTFGGRASGPEPLEELFRFVVAVFQKAKGRRLTSIECHDVMCKVAEVVVVGGVRRSAMISLSNLSDDRMRHAKAGAWWEANVQRSLSNNSAVYTEKPEVGQFLNEWVALYESKSGERGIFNREASQKVASLNGRRDTDHEFGTNPCSEIILRPYQFCNLTEVVVRANDTPETLLNKVRLATIMGTFQSTLTDFPYLRKIWKKNTEEERLLGVSLTGIYDSAILNNYNDQRLPLLLKKLKEKAIESNKEYADILGIQQSAAITCVKPSGTVSQLVDAASGIHPRHDPFYLRRVRSDNKDPLTAHLIASGVPNEPDVTKPHASTVFTFAKKAPEGAMVRSDVSAIDHLELWLVYQRHWCEHKPSVTINVKENEWPEVGAWVWNHFDEVSGVSFLPFDGGSYRQAPYETITEDEYNEWLKKIPAEINWEGFTEMEDNVEGTQTLACSAGNCEV